MREITRGQVVGEMSLFTDEPRSATVVAVRDSVLARLGKPDFDHLLATSGAALDRADAPDHPPPAERGWARAARSAGGHRRCCRSATASAPP